MTDHNQERAQFEAYMHGREHPGFGWIDQHWFRRGDDPAGYANEYVQGAWVMWKARAHQPASVAVPDFTRKIIKKLERVHACFTDGQDADIDKDWLDVLTKLGLLDRVQRSPALWQISDAGDALLDQLVAAQNPVSGEQKSERQEPVAIKSHGAWDGLDDLDSLPDGTMLYTSPQPVKDVQGLVEALERIADARETPTLGDPNALRVIAFEALVAHRAQQGEQKP